MLDQMMLIVDSSTHEINIPDNCSLDNVFVWFKVLVCTLKNCAENYVAVKMYFDNGVQYELCHSYIDGVTITVIH